MPKKGGLLEPKKFPDIAKFLEAKHKDLFEIAVFYNKIGAFSNHKSSIGIIVPDAAAVKKLKQKLESDNAEEAEDEFLRLVLLGDYTDLNTLKAKPYFNTSAGYKIKIKEVKNGEVILDNGASLKVCPEFKIYSRRGHFKSPKHAVFLLKGDVELSKDRNEFDIDFRQNRPAEAEGAGESGSDIYTEGLKCMAECISQKKYDYRMFFQKALGKWCKDADADEKKAFEQLCVGSPTADFVTVFGSGAFDTSNVTSEDNGDAGEYQKCCSCPGKEVNWQIEKDNAAERKFKKIEAIYREYSAFVKEAFQGTSLENEPDKVFDIHCVIFKVALSLTECNKDSMTDDCVGHLRSLHTFLERHPDFTKNQEGRSALDPHGMIKSIDAKLDEDTYSVFHKTFIYSVCLRSPLCKEPDLKVIHGADEEYVCGGNIYDMPFTIGGIESSGLSKSTIDELRAYKNAYGKSPEF